MASVTIEDKWYTDKNVTIFDNCRTIQPGGTMYIQNGAAVKMAAKNISPKTLHL
ncbi:MAG: hypothetical protein QM642_12265 [Edaphocola sp.]